MKEKVKYIVMTASDSGAKGQREDVSGQIIVDALNGMGFLLVDKVIIPDSKTEISEYLSLKCDNCEADIIITTGGTGFTVRDVTPEATLEIGERMVPGISEALRFEGLKKTPHAMLSRGISVIRKQTLIVNLPGSPKAVREGMGVLSAVLVHAVDTLRSLHGVECGNIA
jgi:molybdenum cofactor synthesis domain-containing protein